ncbi:SDR family oxidoreductase [Candidatus Parcubacteria bacterium]|nr:MAG: SDR family oxidoreductase [Candidatus Parcubacteria bacterium]
MSDKTIKQLFDFSNKVVVVTGGSMGIGYGIVKRFVEAGAQVIIADLEEPHEKIQATFVKTDVSQEKDVENLFSVIKKDFGRLDVFINNAGIFPSATVADMTLELWEKVQAVNLRGVFLCCKGAAQLMKQNQGGSIINVASIDALHPSQLGLAAYDASKHGVWGFSKNFALEAIKDNIRVNAIAPGGIRTEGVEKMTGGAVKAGAVNDETMKQFTAKIPLGRFGQPDEMATVALFLASEASSYIVGEIIVADGGYLLA